MGVRAKSFYLPDHQTIYGQLAEMLEHGTTIDSVSLTQALADRNLLETAGGAARVSELFTFLPTAANAEFYARTVLDKELLRGVIASCRALEERAYVEQDDVPGLIGQFSADAAKHAEGAPKRGGLPEIRDAFGLLADPPAKPPELVEGILHQGSKLVLGGASKSNKTWSLSDLGVSVAAGVPWWGFETQKSRVLYLNLEIPEPFFVERIGRICAARGVKLAKGDLSTWNLRGYCTSLQNMVPEIIKVMKGEGFGLVILDPIYKLLNGKDENSAGDVGQAVNQLERVAVETGAGVAFAAHYAKGNASGKDAIDRISGSGVFARDPDAILTVTAHDEPGAFTVEPILRNHAPVQPFVLRWDFPLMARDESGLDPAKLKKARTGRDALFSDLDAVAVLRASPPLTTDQWQRKCEEETGMSRRTFFEIKKRLVAAKKVTKGKLDPDKWNAI